MIFTVHGLVGAALGNLSGRADLAFLLGVVSHAALDAVPHTDYTKGWHGAVDVAAGALTVYGAQALAGVHGAGAPLLWGALGGVLPDLEVAFSYLFRGGKGRLFFPSHTGMVPHRQLGPGLPGVATQLAAAALAALILLLV